MNQFSGNEARMDLDLKGKVFYRTSGERKGLGDEVIPWVCKRNQFQKRKAVYMLRGWQKFKDSFPFFPPISTYVLCM